MLASINSPASVVYVSESTANKTGDHFHPFLWAADPERPGGPSTGAFDTSRNQTLEVDSVRHQSGFNSVYADGHAKWGIYEGAFDPRQ